MAEIVGRTPAACRQLATSARRRICDSQRSAIPAAQRATVVRNFRQAWEAKDINALIGLLASDVTATGDGGGLARAELRPIEGAEQVAHFFVDRAPAAPDVEILERTVNGQPGLVVALEGIPGAVLAFDIVGDRITHIWAVLNPDKLRPWTGGLMSGL